MNAKTLTILIVLFILINVGLFLILNKDTFTKKATIQTVTSSNPDILYLPISPTRTGATPSSLVYNFSGRVTNIESVGSDTKLTLDTSKAGLPEFLIREGALVFKSEGSKLVQTQTDSIKIGSNVVISMTYDLYIKTWTLNTVSIPQD